MVDTEPVSPAHLQPVVVALPGEIDITNAHQVRQRLYAALDAGAPVVVADMTATRFCDSMGLRALVLAHKRASACSGELRVAVTSKCILRIMDITKLDTVMRIYPSAEEALATARGNDQGNAGSSLAAGGAGAASGHGKVRGTTGRNREHAGQTG